MHANSIRTAVALTLSVLSVGAYASTYNGECTSKPKSEWLSTADVKARFEAKGYTVGKVKASGSCYEVYTRDKSGRKAELFVNPADATVVSQADKK